MYTIAASFCSAAALPLSRSPRLGAVFLVCTARLPRRAASHTAGFSVRGATQVSPRREPWVHVPNVISTSCGRPWKLSFVLRGVSATSLPAETPRAKTPAAARKTPDQFPLVPLSQDQERPRGIPALPASVCVASEPCCRSLAAPATIPALHAHLLPVSMLLLRMSYPVRPCRVFSLQLASILAGSVGGDLDDCDSWPWDLVHFQYTAW
jgi:hypothetical protein